MIRRGFTMVEMLTAIAIIGVLAALLLPAIQAAREAARLTSCRNNLRQIGVAALLHEERRGHFPYGGWGHEWVGMPERGAAERQPGGWVYNLLPYLELTSLHDLGGRTSTASSSRRLTTPVPIFTCPTRRTASLWAVSARFPYMRRPQPAGDVSVVARGDYAINGGATLAFSYPGPDGLDEGDRANFVWPDLRGPVGKPQFAFSGISHIRTGARMRQIEDGASCTYLAGEKYLDPRDYENGESAGDNEALVSGYCSDNHRFTTAPPAEDGSLAGDPLSDYRFGSAHPAGAHLANCDGSVRLVSYDILPDVYRASGHIADGAATGP